MRTPGSRLKRMPRATAALVLLILTAIACVPGTWFSATGMTILGKPRKARSQVVVPPAPIARSAAAISSAMLLICP